MASAATYAPTGFSYYVWWFPGSPVRVHLSLDVVRRLREQLPTTPAQGLLFGKTADGATEILDFQSSPGPIPESVSALAEDGGKPLLVGCYRTGDSLTLNDGDRALARTFFAQPYHVILVVQPAEVGPPTASFFFHDADGKMAECSLMEFPFEPSLLASEERDRLRRSQEAAARRSAALQPAESAEPAQKTRGLRRLLPALLCIARDSRRARCRRHPLVGGAWRGPFHSRARCRGFGCAAAFCSRDGAARQKAERRCRDHMEPRLAGYRRRCLGRALDSGRRIAPRYHSRRRSDPQQQRPLFALERQRLDTARRHHAAQHRNRILPAAASGEPDFAAGHPRRSESACHARRTAEAFHSSGRGRRQLA